MKPVIGLLLAFTGLAIGYMVITGKLPSGQTSTGTVSKGAAPVNPSTNVPNLGIGQNISGGGIKIA